MNGSFKTPKIIKGPSKFDLMVALFDRRGNNGNPHVVTFTTEWNTVISVTITGMSLEDGSGESWLFEGYATEKRHLTDTKSEKVSGRVSGWFNTERRTGTFKEHLTERTHA
jgi:hypothetical protein